MNFFVVTLFIGLISAISAVEFEVPEYSDSDFESKIGSHETALVMFYAPWCGHCKKLKPEYTKAAQELKRDEPPAILVKIDCTEGGKETCKKYDVSGYPTLKIFKNGKYIKQYEGDRDAPGIVKYMRSLAGPSSKELKTKEEIDAFITNSSDVVIVGYFQKRGKIKNAFLSVTEKLRDNMKFAHCDEKEVLEEAGIAYGIVLYRPKRLQNKFEDNKVEYQEEDPDETKIEKFATNNYHGLVGHRTSFNKDYFKKPLVTAYYGVDYVKNAKGTNYWRNRILKVASNFKNKYTFAISDASEFSYEIKDYDKEYSEIIKPFIVANDNNNERFIMKTDFSVETFENFLNDLSDGKVEAYIKSEPIPEDNNGPVKVAVAKNFEELVLKSEKDTMVEFYAPWCGHCKELAPKYEELAKKVGDEVDIVKMDATANDVPDNFKTDGFPTLYWVPKTAKNKPVLYEGERNLDDLLKYVAKHATEELKKYNRKGKLKKGGKKIEIKEEDKDEKKEENKEEKKEEKIEL